jgi:hypothetical protein
VKREVLMVLVVLEGLMVLVLNGAERADGAGASWC